MSAQDTSVTSADNSNTPPKLEDLRTITHTKVGIYLIRLQLILKAIIEHVPKTSLSKRELEIGNIATVFLNSAIHHGYVKPIDKTEARLTANAVIRIAKLVKHAIHCHNIDLKLHTKFVYHDPEFTVDELIQFLLTHGLFKNPQ